MRINTLTTAPTAMPRSGHQWACPGNHENDEDKEGDEDDYDDEGDENDENGDSDEGKKPVNKLGGLGWNREANLNDFSTRNALIHAVHMFRHSYTKLATTVCTGPSASVTNTASFPGFIKHTTIAHCQC